MSSQSILLPKHEVHLWYFQTDHLLGASEKMVSRYLDASEYQRYKRFSCPNKRQQFLAARVLLKQLLSQYLGKVNEKVQLKYAPEQKPFLEGNLAFNISHSGKHLLIGVARHAIGVDIQEEGATQEEHVFQGLSFQEQQKVPRETLYPWWVLKEALWKADNQEANLVQLLDAMPFCPARVQNPLSFLLDSWCASYMKLLQNLHLAWVVNDPQPVMRLNGIPLKLF
jgi:4'-phosphopantetheinyl transferase EntD